MARLNKATFDKIVTAAEEFVDKQRGKWGEDEWRDLLSILKQLGVDLNDETQAYVRQLLEAMRGVYEATGSTSGLTKALTSATKGSVEFVKVHKAIWGYSDWEEFAQHIKENTKVVSRETADYLSEILEALKALVSKRPASKPAAKAKKKAAKTTAKSAGSAKAGAAKPAASKPAAKPAPKAAAQKSTAKSTRAAAPATAPKAAPASPKPAAKKPAAKTKPKAAAQKSAAESTKAAAPATAPKAASANPKPAAKKPAAKPATGKAKPKASGAADDLTAISGIGPALQKKLNDYGITQYAQIAALSAADISKLESEVIKFTGRVERDGWIAQAKSMSKKA